MSQQQQLSIPKSNTLFIEGVAIDTSVNANKWQIPEEDLDFFASSLFGAQLRVDHSESAFLIVGRVLKSQRQGDRVLFQAEVADEKIIEKILRGYITHVSAQVDSDNVECSKCKRSTRSMDKKELIHLCPGAWEIVHKPMVRELSIVASPAYKTTEFKPLTGWATLSPFKAISEQSTNAEFSHVESEKEALRRANAIVNVLEKSVTAMENELKFNKIVNILDKKVSAMKKARIQPEDVKPHPLDLYVDLADAAFHENRHKKLSSEARSILMDSQRIGEITEECGHPYLADPRNLVAEQKRMASFERQVAKDLGLIY